MAKVCLFSQCCLSLMTNNVEHLFIHISTICISLKKCLLKWYIFNWVICLFIVAIVCYGEGNGTLLQHSCLENLMDVGAWWAAVHGVAKSWTRLNDFTFTFHFSLFTFMHWRRKWQPTPVFLPGESQGRGSLVGCHLWGHTEMDTTEAT